MVIKMESADSCALEEKAQQRKEKLKALRRKKAGGVNSDHTSNESEGGLPKPKFRSYKPQDEDLHKNALPEPKLNDVETQIKDQLESANTKVVIDELDITNLAPRKPDWDLKRDVAKKLEKLERRTQKAIAELIRERLKQREENLATIVNAEFESHSSK